MFLLHQNKPTAWWLTALIDLQPHFSRYVIEANGNIRTLTINKASLNDDAAYECVVDEDKCFTEVFVKGVASCQLTVYLHSRLDMIKCKYVNFTTLNKILCFAQSPLWPSPNWWMTIMWSLERGWSLRLRCQRRVPMSCG